MKSAAKENFPALAVQENRLAGLLAGTAVGDALGLPMEGLSPERQRRLFPGELRHHLVAGRGMLSDDTEHTLLVAQTLLEEPLDANRFQRLLARRLRWWLLALPAGVGFATLRAGVKLWLGVNPESSGVFSAGNGPAMRSAILGAFFAQDPVRRRSFVRASAQLTHTDPKAEIAAQAVAEAAAWACSPSPSCAELYDRLASISEDPLWQGLTNQMREAGARGASVAEFASRLGLDRGVTGYAYHTVPVALYAALAHREDFAAALTSAIRCGGDADTVGAITGAIAGACNGVNGIPPDWLARIVDSPRSIALLRRIAERLERQQRSPSPPLGGVSYFWPAIPARNAIFLCIVLFHGFRRLLPPY